MARERESRVRERDGEREREREREREQGGELQWIFKLAAFRRVHVSFSLSIRGGKGDLEPPIHHLSATSAAKQGHVMLTSDAGRNSRKLPVLKRVPRCCGPAFYQACS